jgi:NAD(P)-dependent dehydrogenase (short-subunit alcohol dehydrogenase family)
MSACSKLYNYRSFSLLSSGLIDGRSRGIVSGAVAGSVRRECLRCHTCDKQSSACDAFATRWAHHQHQFRRRSSPRPYTALYNATKHAIEGYSESLDHELRSFEIHLSLVEPAFTRTSLEQNGAQPDHMLSVYDKGRAAMNSTWKNGIATGDPVDVVAKGVVKQRLTPRLGSATTPVKLQAASGSCVATSRKRFSRGASASR